MHENPLLPHRKLRELHALMLRTHALEVKQARKHPRPRKTAREALLAATTIQLLPGDVLALAPGDLAAAQLAPPGKKSGQKRPLPTGLLTTVGAERIPQAVAAAKALQCATTDSVVLAFIDACTSEPGWLPALESAHAEHLPLIVACADATTGRSSRSKTTLDTLSFATITRLAKRIKLPILTVDGEDAVAVYRVMQECVLRARLGGGPAVIWSVLSPASATRARSARPIPRLEHYLATRNISFTR